MTDKKIFIALPCMDELENISGFIQCVKNQTYRNYKLFVCVNQPELWWTSPDNLEICLRNQQTLSYLRASLNQIPLQIIDKSSQGEGWKGKKTGVGYARKILMDTIASEAADHDIILSLDADTTFNPTYFQSLIDSFRHYPKAVAMSVPYYHALTENAKKDRAILHYEIYMRYYALNLWRIKNPYAFTAIGSAIAVPVNAYKKIGGITPHKSGEDFYFLQKLRKFGNVLCWNEEKVYPAARYSDRVGFGTGPAMIKGSGGDWSSYPIYSFKHFDEIKITYELFPELFSGDVPSPMDAFIAQKFDEDNIWVKLRENFKNRENFVRACMHKIDAFRILQYLKWKQKLDKASDEINLIQWFEYFYNSELNELDFDILTFSFDQSEIAHLSQVRDLLVQLEENIQKKQKIT
ncbi:MAG: glycosyltransferase [Bacteroidales bacterium]|nr:glycosyltransferase [Bacteroidales bacterium]MCF8404747.1 glycosyltransferase [Bacteroidales bacterium]